MQHVEQYRKDNEKKEQMEKKKVNLSIQKSPQPPSKLSSVINDEPKTAEAAPVLSLGPLRPNFDSLIEEMELKDDTSVPHTNNENSGSLVTEILNTLDVVSSKSEANFKPKQNFKSVPVTFLKRDTDSQSPIMKMTKNRPKTRKVGYQLTGSSMSCHL